MNSQLENLNQAQESSLMLYLYISNIIVCLIANRGSEDQDNKIWNFIISLVPGIGFLCGACSLFAIVKRTTYSKGKCFLGHKMNHTYSSEAEKWKDGRMPLRLSVGGRDRYTCKHCSYEETVRWSAF